MIRKLQGMKSELRTAVLVYNCGGWLSDAKLTTPFDMQIYSSAITYKSQTLDGKL